MARHYICVYFISCIILLFDRVYDVGYDECLDVHNFINVEIIDLKFESNIVEDITIGITALDCDQLISKLEIGKSSYDN